MKMLNKKILILFLSFFISVTAIVILTHTFENDEIHAAAPVPTPVSGKPPYSEYKGVSIGQTLDETRAKLGIPKEKLEGQDFFEFSPNESAQVYYDAAQKVTAITVTYTGNLDSAPTPKAVFGEDAEVKPDGGIFKMVRYPKAGFWISYNKTGGDDPLIMIAMQKM
jgi:hypothetical protein